MKSYSIDDDNNDDDDNDDDDNDNNNDDDDKFANCKILLALLLKLFFNPNSEPAYFGVSYINT